MTNRTRTGIVLLSLATALAGCGGADSSSTSLAPSTVPPTPPPAPQPGPVQLAVFTDLASAFATSEVRDVDEQVVSFNTASELIWTTDDTRFPGFLVVGDQITGPGVDDYFQVHFGTKNGERRAYLGWSDDWCHCPGSPATIVNIEVVSGRLVITATEVLVPGR